jgi:Bacterial lectin
MGKVRTLFAMSLALALTGACQAATILSTDFSKGDTKGWVLNGDQVKIVDVAGDSARPKALALTTDEGSQTGVAWSELKTTVPSFSYIADVQIRHDDSLGCPADGFAMSFANIPDTATVGGGGGAIGLSGLDQFSAFEINTWRGQGLGTDDERNDAESCTKFQKNVTFAFDVINSTVEDNTRTEGAAPADPAKGGFKIGQILPPTGMKIVNGGFYRYQWNVAEDGTMTAFVTGLSDSNKQFQKVKVLEAKIAPALKAIGFEGHFGLSAATGGAFQTTEIAAVRVDSPVIEPQ